MVYTGLVADVINRLKYFINAYGSSDIANIPLDLCNRGREKIWQEADWEPLIARVALSVSNKQATLPADFGKVINIYYDSLGYGKPDGYYNKDGSVNYGYKIDYPMNTGTGFTQPVITFFYDLPFPPYLTYKKTLSKFTGTGNEAIFFPEELLLRAAQLCWVTERGSGNAEVQLIERDYYRQLSLYKAQVQGVNAESRQYVKDAAGNRVSVRTLGLDGSDPQPNPVSPSFDNKVNL